MTQKGKYFVKNPNKYIGDLDNVIYRSSWEKKFMERCDVDKRIIKWKSEGHPIRYFSDVDQKWHRYFIDFFIQIINKQNNVENLAIEIKPHHQTQRPQKTSSEKRYLMEMKTYVTNQCKWRAANHWASMNGFRFLVLTERELGL
jgi:hypothetical protein